MVFTIVRSAGSGNGQCELCGSADGAGDEGDFLARTAGTLVQHAAAVINGIVHLRVWLMGHIIQ